MMRLTGRNGQCRFGSKADKGCCSASGTLPNELERAALVGEAQAVRRRELHRHRLGEERIRLVVQGLRDRIAPAFGPMGHFGPQNQFVAFASPAVGMPVVATQVRSSARQRRADQKTTRFRPGHGTRPFTAELEPQTVDLPPIHGANGPAPLKADLRKGWTDVCGRGGWRDRDRAASAGGEGDWQEKDKSDHGGSVRPGR